MLSNLFGRGKKKGVAAPVPAAAEAARPQPIDVTDATFAAQVTGSPQLVVVDFWAEWCSPCTTMSAYVSFLAADYAGQLTVAALDVDENPLTAERYGVMALPTLLFLHRGGEVGRIVGLSPYPDIKRQAAQLLAQLSAQNAPAAANQDSATQPGLEAGAS